jgi:hypothetical protein
MSDKQSRNQGFQVDGLPSSQPDEAKAAAKARESRKFDRALKGLVTTAILSAVVIGFASEKHDKDAIRTKVQQAISPKVQTVEEDAQATTADINALQYDATTGRLTPQRRAQLHHSVQVDFARDQADYQTFSFAVARQESEPYSNDILIQDQQVALKALSSIPGSASNLTLGSG